MHFHLNDHMYGHQSHFNYILASRVLKAHRSPEYLPQITYVVSNTISVYAKLPLYIYTKKKRNLHNKKSRPILELEAFTTHHWLSSSEQFHDQLKLSTPREMNTLKI